MTFTVNSLDMSPFLSKLKPEYNVLVSDKSGRNARGNTTIDIVNKKLNQLYVYINDTNGHASVFNCYRRLCIFTYIHRQ